MAPKYETVSFGDSTLYTAGAMIPDGKYALEFDNVIDRGKEGKGAEKLAVKVKFYPLPYSEGAKVLEHTYGMGKAAHLSMRPHPDNPKQLVKVPDGPNPNFNDNTKWAIFKNSLHQAGMEEGILTDTFEAIDGVHVVIANQPAPKEWAEIGKNADLAGEGGPQTNGNRPTMIPVVSMIEDDGKPWENGGGIPTGEAAPKVAKPNGKLPAKPVVAKSKAKVAVEDIAEIAELAISAHMAVKANEDGCSKTALKAGAFAWIGKNHDEDTANKFMEEVAEDNDVLSGILGKLGYEIKGIKISPAA